MDDLSFRISDFYDIFKIAKLADGHKKSYEALTVRIERFAIYPKNFNFSVK